MLAYVIERYGQRHATSAIKEWREVAATSDEPYAHSILASFALTSMYGRNAVYRIRSTETDEVIATIGEQP
jgi:hypothetical protein